MLVADLNDKRSERIGHEIKRKDILKDIKCLLTKTRDNQEKRKGEGELVGKFTRLLPPLLRRSTPRTWNVWPRSQPCVARMTSWMAS